MLSLVVCATVMCARICCVWFVLTISISICFFLSVFARSLALSVPLHRSLVRSFVRSYIYSAHCVHCTAQLWTHGLCGLIHLYSRRLWYMRVSIQFFFVLYDFILFVFPSVWARVLCVLFFVFLSGSGWIRIQMHDCICVCIIRLCICVFVLSVYFIQLSIEKETARFRAHNIQTSSSFFLVHNVISFILFFFRIRFVEFGLVWFHSIFCSVYAPAKLVVPLLLLSFG